MSAEGWYEASSILGIHNSEVTCKYQCYLVDAAWCKWTDDHFYVREKTYSNYVEDTMCHHTKYSYLGNQVHGICGTLLYIIVYTSES